MTSPDPDMVNPITPLSAAQVLLTLADWRDTYEPGTQDFEKRAELGGKLFDFPSAALRAQAAALAAAQEREQVLRELVSRFQDAEITVGQAEAEVTAGEVSRSALRIAKLKRDEAWKALITVDCRAALLPAQASAGSEI